MRQLVVVLYTFLLFTSLTGRSQEIIEVDSLKFPWYAPSINYVQFYHKSAIKHFYESLNQTDKMKISIMHMGDSHIQSEIPTGVARQLLQQKYGDGGRGLVFPYSAAKTYSSIHYSSKHEGNWQYAKTLKVPPSIPLGIMGMSVKTEDSTATLTYTFNNKFPSNYKTLKIYCNIDSLSYDINIETDGVVYPIDIDAIRLPSNLPYVLVNVNSLSNVITLKCVKTAKSQKEFLFYGLEIGSNDDKGIVYHSAGVGGSRFKGLLHIEKFNSHLKTINPDLVILDLGTNDFLYDDSIKSNLRSEIVEIITNIRIATPLASVLLCTTQDLYYKQKNIESCEKFSRMLQGIAKELDCALWDWFWISGGPKVLKNWQAEGLARTDLIHLTNSGYKVKGKLLYDGIENTMAYIKKNPNYDSLLIDVQKVKERKTKEFYLQEIAKKDSVNLIAKLDTAKIHTTIVKEEKIIDIPSKQTEVINPIVPKKDTIVPTIPVLPSITLTQTTETIASTPVTPVVKGDSISITKTTLDSLSSVSKEALLDSLNTVAVVAEQKKMEAKRTHTISPISDKITVLHKEEILQAVQPKPAQKNTQKNTTKQYAISQKALTETIETTVKDTTTVVKPKPVKVVPPKPKYTYYKVRSGDNLSTIADRHGCTVDQLKTWNRLKGINLSVGQTLIIMRK
jgi:LysM repeat protein/lysophospholipase L1-like esterase